MSDENRGPVDRTEGARRDTLPTSAVKWLYLAIAGVLWMGGRAIFRLTEDEVGSSFWWWGDLVFVLLNAWLLVLLVHLLRHPREGVRESEERR